MIREKLLLLHRKLAAQYTLYALFMTFITIIAYAYLYPVLKGVIDEMTPSMGEAEATLLSLVPLFILMFILWGGAWYVMPRRQE